MAIYADDLGGNSLSATKNESMLYRGGRRDGSCDHGLSRKVA